MGNIRKPAKVKVFFGIITGYVDKFIPDIKKTIEQRLGKIDLESPGLQFDFTDYYAKDMGTNLKRVFLSLEKLFYPDFLVTLKRWTNYLEFIYSRRSGLSIKRPVNIDPGYVSLSKVVLASTKDYSHRLYLGSGIYAEVTLNYKDKKFVYLPWTYPDYRTSGYLNFFYAVRDKLKKTLAMGK